LDHDGDIATASLVGRRGPALNWFARKMAPWELMHRSQEALEAKPNSRLRSSQRSVRVDSRFGHGGMASTLSPCWSGQSPNSNNPPSLYTREVRSQVRFFEGFKDLLRPLICLNVSKACQGADV